MKICYLANTSIPSTNASAIQIVKTCETLSKLNQQVLLITTNVSEKNFFYNYDVKYKFNGNNSIAYNTRRNRKTNLTEYYNFIYEYKNDCLVAAIEYNKDYYQDRDLQPNEQIFFSLTITPFTSINSPSLK